MKVFIHDTSNDCIVNSIDIGEITYKTKLTVYELIEFINHSDLLPKEYVFVLAENTYLLWDTNKTISQVAFEY